MPDTTHLRAGDRYQCPRCRTPHTVEQPYRDSSSADKSHLYITCRGARYFVGQDIRAQDDRSVPDA